MQQGIEVIAKRKKGLLILFILSFLIFSVLQVLVADASINVTINGKEEKVGINSTVGQALDQLNIQVKPGALKDVHGQILNPTGGGQPIITINGKNVNSDTILQAEDKVWARDGRDLVENTLEEKIALPFEVVKQGKGLKSKIIQPGKAGLKIIHKGAVSGKVFREEITINPVNEIISYYNPNNVPPKMKPGDEVIPVRYLETKGEKVVALTFDDGPGIYTPQVLEILKHYNVKATFFMIGSQVKRYPGLAQEVVAQGHAIGDHTMNHANLNRTSGVGIRNEILGCADSIYQATGVTINLFRPPGGRHDKLTRQLLKEHGYQLIMWSVDPQDWNHLKAGQIEENILTNVRNGSIILLHDGGGNREETVKALPTIIATLKSRGYTFVSL